MKQYLLLLIIVAFITNGHSQSGFQKRMGTTNFTDNFYSVCVAADSGYVFCGEAQGYGVGHGIVAKTTKTGALQWAKHFGGNNNDVPYSIKPLATGGFIASGRTNSSGDTNPLILRLDNSGNMVWKKTITGAARVYIFDVAVADDGSFVFCGSNNNNGTSGNMNAMVLKTDSAGNTIWFKTIGVNSYDESFFGIVKSYDKGYVMVGKTLAYLGGGLTIAKIDSNGVLRWSRAYGSANGLVFPESGGIVCTKDSGYAIAAGISNGPDFDTWLLKTDSLGVKKWTYEYGTGNTDEVGYGITQTTDGSLIVAGSSRSYSHNTYTSGLLLKTNPLGSLLWMNLLKDSVILYAVNEAPGKNLIAVGAHKTNFNYDDGYILKADSAGNSGTCVFPVAAITNTPTYSYSAGLGSMLSTSAPATSTLTFASSNVTPPQKVFCATGIVTGKTDLISGRFEPTIFPNPTGGEFTIQSREAVTVKITSVLGEQIYCSKTTGEFSRFDLGPFPNGIYFIEISDDGFRSVTKILKQ
jgi:hypothetical protein